MLRSIQHKLRTQNFFLCTFSLQEYFLLSENAKEGREGDFSDLLALPAKPLASLLAPCSSLLGVQTFNLLLELGTTELSRGDIRDMIETLLCMV